MRWRIPLVVALVVVVAQSCDQQPVEPSQATAASAPNYGFSNNPTERGPFVRIQTDVELWAWFARAEEYWVYAYSRDWECGFDSDWEYVTIKEILREYEDRPPLLMQTWQGDVNVLVGIGDPGCENVVAAGKAYLRVESNDAFADMEGRDRNRMNAYSWKLNGRVTMVDGGSMANLYAMYHETWTGAPDCITTSQHLKVTLN
jgi:hypothetical protein